MKNPVRIVLSNLEEQVRSQVTEKIGQAIRIVEEGAVVVHHHQPAEARLLPHPVGHCPFSAQPLYPPPSIQSSEHSSLREFGKKVKQDIISRVEAIKSRSIRDMEDFS